MFDIAFGATLWLHITIVHLLIKDLYLEKWKCQLLDVLVCDGSTQTDSQTRLWNRMHNVIVP